MPWVLSCRGHGTRPGVLRGCWNRHVDPALPFTKRLGVLIYQCFFEPSFCSFRRDMNHDSSGMLL